MMRVNLLLTQIFSEHIESEEVAIKVVNKNLENLRLQLEKLNKYIFRETDTKETLVKNNVLIENDFVLELKVS
jgi:hypothetical protein